jgi:hypothetical protein
VESLGGRSTPGDRFDQSLATGEEALCSAFLTSWRSVGRSLHGPWAIITNQRLLIVKDRLVGGPKIADATNLGDIESTGVGPLMGVGPTWSVAVVDKHKRPAQHYFLEPNEATEFHDWLRSVVGA